MEYNTREREVPAKQAAAGDHSDSMAEDEPIPCSSLDVSSEHFDPLLALYSPKTPLPFPEARCFNNLAEYESFLRGGGRARGAQPGSRKSRSRKQEPDPGRIEKLKKLMLPVEEGATQVRPRKSKVPKNVLTRMPLHEGSPLGELNRCVQDRIRIKVHIRTFKGLRGVCSGFIVAFDKFWNMAMVDVDETYRKPVLGKAFYNEQQLTLNQLFERLKLQESELQSSASLEDASSKMLSVPTLKTRLAKGKKTENLPCPSSRVHKKKAAHSTDRTTVEGESNSQTGGKKRTKRQRKKVDYQQVFTRHLKQVFIRGESILLIHVAE
ncbi:U7 snRNA-associated Sm-like protein LSm11 [Bombina bombina]|uniref:U7 snRNA-associated Sm-like protein LSm11 n=1 Tax=Bombina bombina TaxID=8345 RepID=UPI00235AEE75|nr:U7 snRNA-associated Sm-like protein LSm11 [Bombina bombina]